MKQTPRRERPGEGPEADGRSGRGHVFEGSGDPRSGSAVIRSLCLAREEPSLESLRGQNLDTVYGGNGA